MGVYGGQDDDDNGDGFW